MLQRRQVQLRQCEALKTKRSTVPTWEVCWAGRTGVGWGEVGGGNSPRNETEMHLSSEERAPGTYSWAQSVLFEGSVEKKKKIKNKEKRDTVHYRKRQRSSPSDFFSLFYFKMSQKTAWHRNRNHFPSYVYQEWSLLKVFQQNVTDFPKPLWVCKFSRDCVEVRQKSWETDWHIQATFTTWDFRIELR